MAFAMESAIRYPTPLLPTPYPLFPAPISFQDLPLQRHLSDGPVRATAGAGL